MNIRRILVQAIVGAILFTIMSVALEGSYGQEVWVAKGMSGIIFGVLYGVFIALREKFIKKE